jgi:hypothetical protein
MFDVSVHTILQEAQKTVCTSALVLLETPIWSPRDKVIKIRVMKPNAWFVAFGQVQRSRQREPQKAAQMHAEVINSLFPMSCVSSLIWVALNTGILTRHDALCVVCTCPRYRHLHVRHRAHEVAGLGTAMTAQCTQVLDGRLG